MATDELGGPEPPAGDRLLTALFLVAFAHLIVILGVTFSAPPASDGPGGSLEVVIVGNELPEASSNEDATYLSQRTQEGAGNVDDAARAELAPEADTPEAREALQQDEALAAAERLLAAQGVTSTRYVAAPEPVPEPEPTPAEVEVAPDIVLEGPRKDELLVTADTRRSDVAVYRDAWRRKVERIGTLNFPNAARRQEMTGSPVLEVALTADGGLEFVRVRRSSGHPELDQAAVDILKLASPFDPFPRELTAEYKRLRFAYEWQFTAGRVTGSAIGP